MVIFYYSIVHWPVMLATIVQCGWFNTIRSKCCKILLKKFIFFLFDRFHPLHHSFYADHQGYVVFNLQRNIFLSSLPLLGEFSYSSIIFFVKILIQFVACVFLGRGLFIILVNIDLSSFLWGLVIFSQLTTFSARVWGICASPLSSMVIFYV